MATNKVISAGTGRRKTACARVTLVPGEGKWTVNKVPLETSSSRSRSPDSTRPPWT